MSRKYLKVGDVVRWYGWSSDGTVTVLSIDLIGDTLVTTPRYDGSRIDWEQPYRVGNKGWIIVRPVDGSNAILKSGGNI